MFRNKRAGDKLRVFEENFGANETLNQMRDEAFLNTIHKCKKAGVSIDSHKDFTWTLKSGTRTALATCFSKTVFMKTLNVFTKVWATYLKHGFCRGDKCAVKKILMECKQCVVYNGTGSVDFEYGDSLTAIRIRNHVRKFKKGRNGRGHKYSKCISKPTDCNTMHAAAMAMKG